MKMVAKTKNATTRKKPVASKKRVAKTTAVEKKKTAVKKPPAPAEKKQTAAPKEPAGAEKKPIAPKKPAVAKKKPAAPKKPAVAKKEKSATPEKPAIAKKKPAAPKKPASAKKKPASPKTPVAETTDAPKKAISPYQEKQGEEYMNAKQSQHFRKLLINWKQRFYLNAPQDVSYIVFHMNFSSNYFSTAYAHVGTPPAELVVPVSFNFMLSHC